MPWTRSLKELSVSPLEAASGETLTLTLALASAVASGDSINSPAVTVSGGPSESESLWTDVTSTVYMSGSVAATGTNVSLRLHSFTVGYAYRVTVTWNSQPSGTIQTISRFVIVRCLY